MDPLDLVPDLNSQDDDGFGSSTLADATVPERIRPGAMRLAGTDMARRWSGSSPTPNDRHATAGPPPNPGG